MTLQAIGEVPRPSTWLRCTGVTLAGLFSIVILSLAVDVVFHVLGSTP
jgi:hypothetical protein